MEGVTVYPVISEPPVFTGAFQETYCDAFPETAVTPVGASGTDIGVTEDDAAEAIELPTELVAFTVNVTGVPFVRPVSEAVKTFPRLMGLPVDGVTIYPVIAEPPVFVGADQETAAWPLPATAVTLIGASGTVIGVTEDDTADKEE
jgi:hypothetical protein